MHMGRCYIAWEEFINHAQMCMGLCLYDENEAGVLGVGRMPVSGAGTGCVAELQQP